MTDSTELIAKEMYARLGLHGPQSIHANNSGPVFLLFESDADQEELRKYAAKCGVEMTTVVSNISKLEEEEFLKLWNSEAPTTGYLFGRESIKKAIKRISHTFDELCAAQNEKHSEKLNEIIDMSMYLMQYTEQELMAAYQGTGLSPQLAVEKERWHRVYDLSHGRALPFIDSVNWSADHITVDTDTVLRVYKLFQPGRKQ